VRILAVCAVTHPGGAEIGLLRLAKRLLARGHVLTLATPGPGPLDDAGLPVVRLPLGGLGQRAGARAAASYPRARRLAAGHDLVYLNGTVSGRLLPGLVGRRTILHVHDIVDRVPRFWSRADAVLADSGAVAKALPGLDAHVVYCPVELEVPDAPAPWPPDDAAGPPRPVVGFVGRIEPRKGPLDLVRAAPAIRAAVPDVRIVLVGDDPYDSAPDYAAQVRAAQDVEHIPWVPDGAAVMRHLDVLVAPSRQEPFGTVLAEAMAAGTPVVATRVGGLAEVVADGVTGRLVAPGDPAELAAAVLEVLADRACMGTAAREHARRFGADAYADRVEAILLEVART
jgi:glycosyltransferase involved in cell wall biosynthesis